eukprot:scaffold36608_cov78-Phaeocystis_antarctica.AAC.2
MRPEIARAQRRSTQLHLMPPLMARIEIQLMRAQQRTPPLVGGGGDPERLHGLTRSTTTLPASMIGGHAPIRSSGLGRGT